MSEHQLSTRGVVLLAIVGGIITANAYYIHPIIGRVAGSFGVSDSAIGAVPALNQIALALGVLLLLPLGDRMSNRRLAIICLSVQVLALIVMATVENFYAFVAASMLLGFFTVTPYLLPTYASKHVDTRRLGFVTAVLTTGVIAGVQLSRVSSGIIGEYLGWRSVYWIAAALMTCATFVIPMLLKEPPVNTGKVSAQSYPRLIHSMWELALSYPRVIMSGLIQGFSFAIFLAVWLGIGLHLTSDPIGLGTDVVGYLAGFSAIGLMMTARLGKWADGFGAERARVVMACVQFLGILCLALAINNWWFLLLPIVIMSIVGPLIDVTGRIVSLNQAPAIRTRLMTLYVTVMFIVAGIGSWAATFAYDVGGWYGTIALASSLSILVCLLSIQQYLAIRADTVQSDEF